MKLKKRISIFFWRVEREVNDLMFFFYTEKLDILLWVKRKKWIGIEVYGTLEKGMWLLYQDTDSGTVTDVYRNFHWFLPGYVYFIDNGKDKDWRTLYVRDKKKGMPKNAK
jgi:hypothetical protein